MTSTTKSKPPTIKIKTFVNGRDGYKIVGFDMTSYNAIEYEIGNMSSGFHQRFSFCLKDDVFEKVDNSFRLVRFFRVSREIEDKITAIERQKKFAEEFIERMFKAIEERGAK